ncbi:MAG TPA: hypothetical protein VKB09_00955 [Thermomicrobiales bacterium]|nr:hypothetical protein [Thermomicrobiales bacterium]
MATTGSALEQQAATYEQYLRDNWDRMPAWEQEQAQQYFAWKGANPRALTEPPPMLARPAHDQGLHWSVKAGYICAVAAFLLSPLIFAPLAILLGIYNIARGRYVHSIAHVLLAVAGTILAIVLSAIMLDWLQVLQHRLVELQSQQR